MFCLLSTLTLRLSDLSPTFFSEAGFLRSLFHIILLLDVYLSLFTFGYLGISLPFLYLYTQGIGIYRYLFTYNASSFPMCLYQLSCIIHPLYVPYPFSASDLPRRIFLYDLHSIFYFLSSISALPTALQDAITQYLPLLRFLNNLLRFPISRILSSFTLSSSFPAPPSSRFSIFICFLPTLSPRLFVGRSLIAPQIRQIRMSYDSC